MTTVEIKITAKVGAARFEIESNEGDVLHHISGSDFLKRLMDLASYIDAPDADVPELSEALPANTFITEDPTETIKAGDAPRSESSMGSVDKFLAKGTRVTPLKDGTVMEEDPIFSPESVESNKPVRTFGSRVAYGSSPEEQKKKEAMERLNDADGWVTT